MSSDAIGEHYCLSELLLAEKEAYLANGVTQKGWDIAVLDGDKTIRVQVKCINWRSSGQAAVKGTFITQEFDYLIIVLLHFNDNNFTSYVIPYDKLKEKSDTDRTILIDDNGNVYYSARKLKKNNKSFEKQAIAISTLGKQEIQEQFEQYKAKFDQIKNKSE
jgi:hypothetical protein